MNNNQKIFINILKDFLYEQHDNYVDADWDIINRYSHKHQLGAVFYYQTHQDCFLKEYQHQLYVGLNINYEVNKIQKAIDKYPYFIVKGTEIAELYPVKILRSMSDIDIITTRECKEELASKILSLGYIQPIGKEFNLSYEHEWEFYGRIIGIELHHGLYYQDSFHFYDKFNMRFFDHCWEYVVDHKLDWNFHFLYVIVHLMKHLLFQGVGFRQFLDVAVITKNQKLDWQWIENKAEEIGILSFLQKILKINEMWFDVPSPFSDVHVEESFYEIVTECVFEAGCFGFGEDRVKNRIINIERGKGKLTNYYAFIKEIFPSYSQMVKVDDYQFLQNKKYLLPYAWIYRIATKWNKKENVISNHFIDKEMSKQRDEYLSEWGL